MNLELQPGVFLTTERAESSYGLPVVVIDGIAHAPGAAAAASVLLSFGAEFHRLRAVQAAALRVASSVRNGVCLDRGALELLDRALEDRGAS